MQLNGPRSRIAGPTVRALHQDDVEAVLGKLTGDQWNCSRCKMRQVTPPAAYVKQDATLLPLCAACFLEVQVLVPG